MKNLVASWQNNERLFLLQGERQISYAQFHADITRWIESTEVLFPRSACMAVCVENEYSSFVRFIGGLIAGHTMVLVAKHQFYDPHYRKELLNEIKSDAVFIDSQGVTPAGGSRRHPLMTTLSDQVIPQFVIRTSGSSSARYKFILHRADLFIEKYRRRGSHFCRTLAFSPAESIAGVETLMEVLVTGASLVAAGDRLSPTAVVDLIDRHQIDYFQTTPSFLNLMALTRSIDSVKMASLQKIAFGSEPSSERTLTELRDRLNQVELCHTYGMSEIGIQVTRTDSHNPTRLILDEDYNPGRISDGAIEVHSMTPLVGYLNAPTLLRDGWFATGDRVVMEDGFWRILGRDSDLINLAGRKFFPGDVENLLMKMPEIGEVTIITEKNDLVGQVLTAQIVLRDGISKTDFPKKFKSFCEARVPFYMHPHRVTLVDKNAMESRTKKIRRL